VFAIEVCALLSAAGTFILWQRGFGWPWSLAPWAVYGSLVVEFGMKAWLNQPSPRGLPWPTGCGEMDYGLPLAVSSTHSFPSGYSTRMGFFLTLLVAAAFMRGRVIGALAAVLATIAAALLGWSRAYIGWHWPLDVLGGVLFGAGIAGITFAVLATRAAGARSARSAGPPTEAAQRRLSANAPPG
jgi:membrane-associated phospholipid phosphatase